MTTPTGEAKTQPTAHATSKPSPTPHTVDALNELAQLLQDRRVLVLTGAGCSTESGIPDYRGPKTRSKARNPIRFQDFVKNPLSRRRYWARSMVGWPRFLEVQPCGAHLALAQLEADGRIEGIVTQNVDRLHHRAGSQRVIELHGSLANVHCLDCGAHEPRTSLQARLRDLNPGWERLRAELAPDGDADLPEDAYNLFKVAGCRACRGRLKPSVVFFGENVPRPIHDASNDMLQNAQALLVVGSSLAVYSGYRFLLHAHKRHIPTALINLGPPHRGAHLFNIHVDAPASATLERFAAPL